MCEKTQRYDYIPFSGVVFDVDSTFKVNYVISHVPMELKNFLGEQNTNTVLLDIS